MEPEVYTLLVVTYLLTGRHTPEKESAFPDANSPRTASSAGTQNTLFPVVLGGLQVPGIAVHSFAHIPRDISVNTRFFSSPLQIYHEYPINHAVSFTASFLFRGTLN